MSANDQEILWTAALLHDVEKRSTSVDEGGGKISAKGHARKGEYTARTILYRDYSVPFEVWEEITALVRYHGLPLWWSEKLNPLKRVCEAALRVDTSLLKYLAAADVSGRICEDKQDLLDMLELFEVKIVYLERPFAVWRKQNRNREYAVPETVLDTMLDKLEIPQPTEAHEVIYHTL